MGFRVSTLLLGLVLWTLHAHAQSPTTAADYVVGPHDVLTITSYDQADLTGKFAVEADGTFTYPLIGRFTAGGLTLRQVETRLRRQLVDEGYFRNPQVTVAVEAYQSQKVFVIGEVRTPGTYTLSGNMTLVEVLARAGSTLPTASGDAVIVHAEDATGPVLPVSGLENVVRVNLRDLERGQFSQNAALRNGDTVFVPRAETVYVFGQVRNPGAFALQQQKTTVLQALALAGGITDRGAQSRIKIRRVENGKEREISVKPSDLVRPGDVVVVPERFF